MFRYNLILLIGLLIFSCKSEPPLETIEVPVLRASAIYDGDSVYNYLQNYKDVHKEIADSYHNKAKDLIETNIKKAIYNYKRSLTLNPSLAVYKELGELLTKNQLFDEAEKLYSLIATKNGFHVGPDYINGYIFEVPDEATFYEYIISKIRSTNRLSNYHVFLAKECGIEVGNLKKRLLDDERFNYDPSSMAYKDIMLQFMEEDEIIAFRNSKEAFDNYITSIKDSLPTFEINEKTVGKFKYDHDDYEGEEDIKSKDFNIYFSKEKQEKPDNWFAINFNNKLKISDSVWAVVYAVDTSELACPVEMRHIYHRMVTYDINGKMIDTKVVAVQSGELLTTTKYLNGKITLSENKRVWKKPYNMKDFDNDLVRTEKVSEQYFEINSNGKITEIKEELIGPAPQQPVIDAAIESL